MVLASIHTIPPKHTSFLPTRLVRASNEDDRTFGKFLIEIRSLDLVVDDAFNVTHTLVI